MNPCIYKVLSSLGSLNARKDCKSMSNTYYCTDRAYGQSWCKYCSYLTVVLLYFNLSVFLLRFCGRRGNLQGNKDNYTADYC